MSVSHSRRQALPSSPLRRVRSQPLSGDDVLSMAMTGVAPVPATVAPSLTETAAAETAVAVDAAPFGAARLNSERGPGPSRTRGAEFCEAKAEAVRHGIARAMALDAAPFPNCGPGPSASTRSAYCREGKAEAGRQGVAGAVALGAAPSGGRRRYADCRILGSSAPNALEFADQKSFAVGSRGRGRLRLLPKES